ncbi:AsnC family protein [Streptomyces canus]|uniref:AsnC family protein n=1 Tax=Streptomyces canus TaxID=58343 RepID=UPI00386D3AFC
MPSTAACSTRRAPRTDGRVPFSRVAAVPGVSAQAVPRRYRRLCADSGLRVVGLTGPHQAGLPGGWYD